MHCMISLTMPMLDLSMSMCLSLSMTPCFLSMLAVLVRSSGTCLRRPPCRGVSQGSIMSVTPAGPAAAAGPAGPVTFSPAGRS